MQPYLTLPRRIRHPLVSPPLFRIYCKTHGIDPISVGGMQLNWRTEQLGLLVHELNRLHCRVTIYFVPVLQFTGSKVSVPVVCHFAYQSNSLSKTHLWIIQLGRNKHFSVHGSCILSNNTRRLLFCASPKVVQSTRIKKIHPTVDYTRDNYQLDTCHLFVFIYFFFGRKQSHTS